MMFLADLQAIGDICQARGVLFAVDNTFASPIFQQPLSLGADLVMHSTTKYLNGHSDMVGGIMVTNREDLAERIGSCRTQPLRMKQHDASGRRVAEWLTTQKKVQKIYYPGLRSHPQHELAKCQMKGFGGMISFDVGHIDLARKILDDTKIFALAESLGGVESLIGHPASQTHAFVPVAMRSASKSPRT